MLDAATLEELSVEYRFQANLFRDIIGNPFYSVKRPVGWLTTDVLTVAAAIYEARAFERMPILGDALEDAGCDKAEILDHCRQPGDHVRGCWVLDFLLGLNLREL